MIRTGTFIILIMTVIFCQAAAGFAPTNSGKNDATQTCISRYADMKCPIAPQPREYHPADACNITISENTALFYDANCPVESYAAEHLKNILKKHYKLDIQLNGNYKETGQFRKNSVEIIFGVLGKDSFIQQFCEKHNINIDANLSGIDGFIIKTAARESSTVIIIAGANERGVTYGANALFDLLKFQDNKLICPAVYIRDWATIAWRGRPCECMTLHNPETLDAYVHSRINFIDIRDTNTPDRWAPFGFLPGEPIDVSRVKKVIGDAHTRGIFVYGTVSCGVSPDKFDAVIETFRQLIALGVDGLWISYDDPGPGEDAPVLVGRVIEQAKKHNITPDKIAVTPPSYSYQVIDTVWNKQIVSVADANKMRWFFTCIPKSYDAQLMRKMGFARPQCWWHNWPRPYGGLLSTAPGGLSLYSSNRIWAYYELLPLSAGWHEPTPDELAKASKYTDMVSLWLFCLPDYACHVLGLWAWNPAVYDFNAVSDTAYSYVFGKAQVPTARLFDSKLVKLKSYFTVPQYKNISPAVWPPRLLNVNDRPTVLKLLDEMDTLMQVLETRSPSESMLSCESLKANYLQLMRDVITYGRKMAKLDYPDYTYGDFADRMLELASKRDIQSLKAELDSVRSDIEGKCKTIAAELADLNFVDAYVKQWIDSVQNADYWVARQAQHQKSKRYRQKTKQQFDQFLKGDYSEYLTGQNSSANGKVLLEISPDVNYNNFCSKGDWVFGIYESAAGKAVAIGSSAERPYKKGDICTLTVETNVPDYDYNKRLYLEFYVAHKMHDNRTPARTDIRFSSMGVEQMSSWNQRIGDKTVWNQDIAVPMKGFQSVDITEVAKAGQKTHIKFFVENKVESSGYETIVFLGPIRLVQR